MPTAKAGATVAGIVVAALLFTGIIIAISSKNRAGPGQ
jgi:VIT1/CCC1 family predicted Fe2+/Mn2+ transporter